MGGTEEELKHRKSLPMPDEAFLKDWLARSCELVDKYQPRIVWFDFWIQHIAFDPYLQKFAAYYYNRAAQWGQTVAINYKNDAFSEGSAVFDVERGQLSRIRPQLWQTDTAVSKNSWGYIKDHDYKTAATLIGDLVDIVSKNGVLLLNIGPRPDGTIPEPEVQLLSEIGAWLAVNGEAIYGTRPWKVFGEGPTEVVEGTFNDVKRSAFTAKDIRFTQKGRNLYAIALGGPEDDELCITTLARGNDTMPGKPKTIQLLGSESPVRWTQDRQALKVVLPKVNSNKQAFALKMVL
jgi:alpha-L-fucosidase